MIGLARYALVVIQIIPGITGECGMRGERARKDNREYADDSFQTVLSVFLSIFGGGPFRRLGKGESGPPCFLLSATQDFAIASSGSRPSPG